ncbi:MAG: EVE domain-containing protein [Deltaproteobacteria bacterium]|nr:EVE domain-containing protein [Deltaproteobacteria bacterium]
MKRWLVKTEPSAYSLDDLEREGRTVWDGVRNPVALRNLRAMRPGDAVFVYHSGGSGSPPAVVGTAEVAGDPRPDPKAAKFAVVDLRFVSRLPRPVALSELKAEPAFADSPLVRQGRLSVLGVTDEQWHRVRELADREP